MTFDIEGGVRRLILILGDQLTAGLGALADIDPQRDHVLLAEVMEEASHVPHHPKKIALIFAAHATDTMGKARLIEGLQAALESRHAIGIAQGVLALRYGITYEQAFDVLRRYSNQSNTKLRAVAAQVLEARDLPRRMPDVLPVENDPA